MAENFKIPVMRIGGIVVSTAAFQNSCNAMVLNAGYVSESHQELV